MLKGGVSRQYRVVRAFLFVLVAPVGTGIARAQSAELVTDRPDETESATVVPRGLVQVETGYLFTRDSGMDSYAVPGTLARIGLGGRTELRIGHAGLIDSLTEARAAGELTRRLRVLTHPALLVVDEIGYPPVSQDGAVLFFQLINARHERASTVLTSNKGFEEWGACSATKSWPRR